MNSYTLRLWSQAEFDGAQEAWESLLSRSNADALFMSWEWQHTWWRCHAGILSAQLKLAAVYCADQLVALAPCFVRSIRVRGTFVVRRLELVGMAWRSEQAAFSENLDLIIDREAMEPALSLLTAWLCDDIEWNELVFAWAKADSVASVLAERLRTRGVWLRTRESSRAHSIRVPPRFTDYVQGLRSNTRRRLYHHRARLQNPEYKRVAGGEIDRAFDRLFAYNIARWGARPNDVMERTFQVQIARAFAERGDLWLTELHSNGCAISFMYNVRVGSTEYYLLSSRDPAAAPGLSLGYLHIGYALEKACGDGIARFDLLAGEGRHRDYKADLGSQSEIITTYHFVRGWPLIAAYNAYDCARRAKAWLASERAQNSPLDNANPLELSGLSCNADLISDTSDSLPAQQRRQDPFVQHFEVLGKQARS